MITVQNVASTDEFSHYRPSGAEKELLIATLDRAVLDYHSSRKELRSDAEEWLYEGAEGAKAFSFEWVCENLGLNRNAVLKRIEELQFSKSVSQRHRWLRKKIQSRDNGARPQSDGIGERKAA